MLGARRFALNGARLALRSNRVISMPMSSASPSFEKKELGEEAAYFKREEARWKQEMRQKMEKLMELEDSHEDKQAIVKLLEKKSDVAAKADQSFIQRLGLDDWRLAVPLGGLIAIPCLAHDVIVIGAEAQLAVMFALFVGTCHKTLGPVASKFFDDYRDTIAKDLKKIDEIMLQDVHQSIDAHQQMLGLENDVSKFIALRDDLAVVQADILNHMEQAKFRDSIQKKLDSLVAIEDAATVAIRNRMVKKVKADVVAEFSTDAKAKEAALTHALSVLAAGAGGKRGKDIVGDAFTKAIASYRTEYSKAKPGSDEIIVQFEKDVAAITQAPPITFKAGNVYDPVVTAAKH